MRSEWDRRSEGKHTLIKALGSLKGPLCLKCFAGSAVTPWFHGQQLCLLLQGGLGAPAVSCCCLWSSWELAALQKPFFFWLSYFFVWLVTHTPWRGQTACWGEVGNIWEQVREASNTSGWNLLLHHWCELQVTSPRVGTGPAQQVLTWPGLEVPRCPVFWHCQRRLRSLKSCMRV